MIEQFFSKYPKLKGLRWKKLGMWRGPLLRQQIYNKGTLPNYFSEFAEINTGYKFSAKIEPYDWYCEETFEEILPKIENKILNDRMYLKRISNKFRLALKNSLALTQKIKNIKKLKNNELEALFNEFVDSYCKLIPYSPIWLDIHNLPEKILNKAIKDKDKVREILKNFAPPKGMITNTAKAQRLLFKIKNELEKNKNVSKVSKYIENYIRKYGWLHIRNWEGNIPTKDEVLDLAMNSSKIELNNIENNENELVNDLRMQVFLKTYRKEMMGKIDFQVTIPLMKEIGNRMGLSYKEIIYCSIEEIKNFFQNGLVPEKTLKRIDNFAILIVEGKLYVETNTKKYNEEKNKEKSKTLFVSGKTAFSGKVKGRVKIITSYKEQNKIKKGDIIVSDMTNPNMIKAINSASGIITNRGGVLCHAAIISRELKKPCLIGTNNATEVFKDGDFITLDAKKGIAYKNHNLNKEDWVWMGQWIQPTLSAYYWSNWRGERIPYHINIDGKMLILDGHTFYLKEDLKKVKNLIDKKRGSKKFLEVLKDWIKTLHHRGKYAVGRPYKNNKEALIHFDTGYKEVTEIWTFMILCGVYLTEYIKRKCKKLKIDFNEVTTIKLPLVSLNEKRIIEAKKLFRKIKENGTTKINDETFKNLDEELKNKIKNHIEEFEFIGIHHYSGEAYSLKKFINNFNQFVDKEITKTKGKIPKELEWDIKLVSIAAYGRMHMAETSGYMQYKIMPILKDLEKQLNFEDGIMWLSTPEILELIEKKININKIDEREKKVGILKRGNTVISGEEVAEILNEIKEDIEEGDFPLKGRPACKGIVKGFAKICLRPEESMKLKKGEILIAHETSPEFVPAMERASAIITEQGGLTSHAAIISREMNTPCIIGVKGATSIIKNNDLIVVDAENGIIKKL